MALSPKKTNASSRVNLFDGESMYKVICAAPVTFVTGKGGVGKTTMASLLSQACASHGERVLFISFFNDVTTQKLLGIDKDLPAGEISTTKLDNIDFVLITPASALSDYLSVKKLGSLTSKLTHSGLLDTVSSIIPGMRELLTIGDIRTKYESKNWDRIIVDTPSTGHASSLFSIADTASSTAQGGVIRQQADSAREFLSDRSKAQIIVVTLDHVMPLSECKEFVFNIEESIDAHIACIVINRSNLIQENGSINVDTELKDIFLPLYAHPPLHVPKTKKKRFWSFKKTCDFPPLLMEGIEIEKEIKTCIVLGTGGVGKTTSSAALAIANARKKKRVALLTIDPARRLGTALGLEDSKNRESYLNPNNLNLVNNKKDSNLHVYQLDSRYEFMEMLERILPKKDFKKAKKNAFVQGVSRAGIINEFMAIESLHRLSTSGEYDLVVVDTPPSHHVFDLIDAPSTLQKVFASPFFKAFVSAGSIAGLGANITLRTFFRPLRLLLGTVLINDTIAFLKMIREVESVFSDHVDEMSVVLKSPTTKYIGIARPDEVSREQLMHVGDQMRLKGFKFSTIVLNGCVANEYDIEGELVPFAQIAAAKGMTTRVLNTYEHNKPIDIVRAMANDIV